jgi:glycosyltransferase involved in cell wall biosynthesis
MAEEKLTFPGRLGIQQRVLPEYRADFFDMLADACEGGLSIFAGEVHLQESIPTTDQLNRGQFTKAHNHHFTTINSPFYLLWQSGLLSWLQRWNPDALVVEANPRHLSTRRAIRWMHNRKRSMIGWGLGAPPIAGGSSLISRLIAGWQQRSRRKFLHSMDAIIAYSRRGAGEYKAESFSPDKIFVATNAVSSKPISQLKERSSEFDPSPKVLFVGRLQSRKRIDNLLAACAKLPDRLRPILRIVGDGPARSEFQRIAQEVFPSAEFPGAMRGPALDKYFAEADLFVLPGSGGLAVQEAMAHGLPVIVAEGDGTQEDLVKPENGWLIPADNEEVLRIALEEALSDPNRLRRMGAASYKIVRDEINIEQMVKVFVQALNSAQILPDSKS